MSKKNKHKNKHKNKNQHNHNHNRNRNHQKPTDSVSEQSQGEEQSPITLDKHLEKMELQSMSASSSDATSTTIAKTDDVTPEGMYTEEKPSEVKNTTFAARNEQETTREKVQSVLNWKMFIAGLAIGAILTSLFL